MPLAAPGPPQGCPGLLQAAVWAPAGLQLAFLEVVLDAFWLPLATLGGALASLRRPLALFAPPQGSQEATKENPT